MMKKRGDCEYYDEYVSGGYKITGLSVDFFLIYCSIPSKKTES